MIDHIEHSFDIDTSSVTGSATESESWGYDTYGNWDVETIDGVAQNNTINSQNQLTAYDSTTTNQAFDDDGNTLSCSTGIIDQYKTWNHR